MIKMNTKKLGMLALALVILPLAGCGGEVVKEAPIQEYTLMIDSPEMTDFPEMPDSPEMPDFPTDSPYVPVPLSQLAHFLPEVPPGWGDFTEFMIVSHPESTVFRAYGNLLPGGDFNAEIIIEDSGYVLSPGEFVGPHQGASIISIEGHPAVEQDLGNRNYILTIYIRGRFVVVIDGRRDTVYMFVDRIDFHGLAALANGTPGDTIEELNELITTDEHTGDTIELNELITTDEHTRKKITIPDVGEVIINVNSEVRFVLPPATDRFSGLTLEQIGGEILYKVRKLEPHQFEIWTSQSVTTPRGTQFLMNVEADGTTTLTVLEGTVEFSDLNEKKTVVVGKNQRSVVEPGGLPAEPVSIDVKQIPIWWE